MNEDQSEFLLRSLEDLEREHDAGDLDDADYQSLKDDYTARAAAVLRAVTVDRPAPTRRGNRAWLALASVVVFAIVAGVLVAQSSGRRAPGDSASGSVSQSITEKLNAALQCFSGTDPDEPDCDAIARYDEVLAQDPDNVEGLTYKGWALHILRGDTEQALTTLIDAATIDPEYPDVHAFLAVLFFQSGLVQQASNELDRLDALDPPPEILTLMEEIRPQIDAALAAMATTTTAG